MNVNEAYLISFITSLANRPLEYEEIQILELRIKQTLDIARVSEANVCDLLKSMRDGRKIDAIKQYRSMTGVGLKEAKEAVEIYWSAQPKQENNGEG